MVVSCSCEIVETYTGKKYSVRNSAISCKINWLGYMGRWAASLAHRDMETEVQREVEGGDYFFSCNLWFLPKKSWLQTLFWMTDESCLSLKAPIDFVLYMLIWQNVPQVNAIWAPQERLLREIKSNKIGTWAVPAFPCNTSVFMVL